ncbi:hypothetical protein Patl1_23469 [Pistacia atlantica]|uniref:Uncharacterized protein n=1 Tax=Pistacia atlantica TaxID=434234 RepID=A0ACC1A0B2_9ROSI|nr:hypothetical protein Patl1_23469 [Pistacia atlantica]
MAFSSFLRSTPTVSLSRAANFSSSSSDRLKLGISVAKSIQPIKATAIELPPIVQKTRSSGSTKIGINGMFYSDWNYSLFCLF